MSLSTIKALRYPGFNYHIQQLEKYIFSEGLGIFTICLKYTRQTIHFSPETPDSFKKWLDFHHIEDIKNSIS